MRRNRGRGFTYIEAVVSIGVVVMTAAIIYPGVVRESVNRSHRLFRKSLVSLAIKTRNRAVEQRRTVSLSYNKDNHTIEVVQEDKNGVSKPFPDLQLPDQVTTTQLYADKFESPADGWRVPFYADGTTTGGGIEFLDDKETYSFLVDRYTAQCLVIPAKLPDLSLQTWPAGGVQKRAQ